jgi:hypothetical protein
MAHRTYRIEYVQHQMNKAKMDIILKSVTKRPEPPLKNLIYKN